MQPGLALAAVAPYKSGPGLASAGGGDIGPEEIRKRPGAQQQHGAECEQRERET